MTTEPQEWAAIFYLCGHFNRPDAQDPFVAALDDIRAAGASAQLSVAVYLDLESGARRFALRAGDTEPGVAEAMGAVNSGDPRTLEQFLEWAFDACPARRYILVMAGLGIMDRDSVVGRPPFDASRTFAICDDRATDDAIELHELHGVLSRAFPPGSARRLVMLACDMYAMQFMEVAYELRHSAEFLVGLQPDGRQDAPRLVHWPYASVLDRWKAVLAAPAAEAGPTWRQNVDPYGEPLAKETVAVLAEHYSTTPHGDAPPVTVSAINLRELTPLAQALDTFSIVFLQWLSNDVMWHARDQTFRRQLEALKHAWAYDLAAVATAIQGALKDAARETVVRWASATLPKMAHSRLSEVLRILGAAARENARQAESAEVFRKLERELGKCRSAVEQVVAKVAEGESTQIARIGEEISARVRRLFVEGEPPAPCEPDAWTAIFRTASVRLTAAQARELNDRLEGIEAAKQLSRLAQRVAELTQKNDEGRRPAIAAVWPPGARCGLALYRPVDLNKLAESNYLELSFSRDLHWTAFLTAIDLIENHARLLWRLLESQLTAAPLEARFQLMHRLAGAHALTGRHADQLRALSAPNAVFLTIEPDYGETEGDDADPGAAEPSASRAAGGTKDPIAMYCVRLSSIDRSATVVEKRNPITRERLERVLKEMDEIGLASGKDAQQASRIVQRLARCGSLLGDDILHGVSEQLAEVASPDGRPVHLVMQMPRELMRYPWELLRDSSGWLVDRFAIGRQLIADMETVRRWSGSRRQGPLRLLVVAPKIEGQGAELAGVGALEGEHVAECFERLQERLPGLVDPSNFRRYVDKPVTVDQFRELLRERRYDVVHFAGHGRFDARHPERSCWKFSDGDLYAFELRHTLANAAVTPWLVYGSACESARETGDPPRGYHDGVYGMASAALGQGVAAYIGPLWRIPETDAKNLATVFYQALLLRRTSIGEALALARRLVREGRAGDDDAFAPVVENGGADSQDIGLVRSAGWTGIALYGDPTPTILQRLSPSEAVSR